MTNKVDYYVAPKEHPLSESFNLAAMLAHERMAKELSAYEGKTDHIEYDLEKKKDYKVFNFDAEKIGPIDLFSWYHNTVNHKWEEIIKKNYIMLAEIPLYPKTHDVINKMSCENEEKFVNFLLEHIIENEKTFSINALRSIYRLISCEKKPLVVGFSERTNGVIEREFKVGSNLLQVLYAIREKIDRPVGFIVGNIHIDNVQTFVKEYSNLELNPPIEVGKIDLNIDVKILEPFKPPLLKEYCPQRDIILKLLEKHNLFS